MTDASDLLRFARQGDPDAFAAFVARHLDFVYHCALRRTAGDAHLAEDITQEVFAAAARDAKRLAGHPVPAGWLYTTTRNLAAHKIRAEVRRRAREQEAAVTEGDDATPIDWERLRPALDDALDALEEEDRQAILLRFFEGRSFAEVGAGLQLAENAARMRVHRALDRMSVVLRRHGITSTAAILSATLAAQPVVTAPAALAGAISASVAAAATAGAGAGVSAFLMSSLKFPLAASTAVLLGTAGMAIHQDSQQARLEDDLAALRQDLAARTAGDAIASTSLAPPQAAPSPRDPAELERLRERTRAAMAQLAALRAESERKQAAQAQRAAPYDGPVLELSQLEARPKPIAQVPPVYPKHLQTMGVSGDALLEFVVDPDGKVRNTRVVSATAPEFGEAAAEAVNLWRWEPGRTRDTRVATLMKVPIKFSLDGAPSTAPMAKPRPPVPWF